MAMPNVNIPQGMDTRSERVLEQPNEPPLLKGHISRSGEGRMEHTFELMDNIPLTPHDSPFLEGNIPLGDEGRMALIQELMETCTSLTHRVLSLEEAKTTQDMVITRLKLRVKSLEKKRKARTPQPMKRRLFKGRVKTSTDKKVIVENKSTGEKGGSIADQVSTARLEVSAATPPKTTNIFGDEDLTITQTLMKMRSEKAKEKKKGVVLRHEEEPPRLTRSTTTLQPLPKIDPKNKAQRLHEEELAELDRVQKERQKQEEGTSAALPEEFDEIQARINKLYEREKKLIDDFEPIDDSSSKPAGGIRKKTLAKKEQAESKSEEKAEADYEHEKEELRMWLTVVPDEEEMVDPEILSTKYPIVDWESQNLGNVDMEDLYVYKIIRADRNTSYHKSLSSMLRKFDRQDLVDLHRLVMKRFEDTTPEGYNLLLWGDPKVIVHTLLMDGTLTCFNMLVEKRYPLIKEMLQKMLNWKLETKAESTTAFELLKFIKSQLED
ncbi:hypothetical protein Tco_1022869 [Tanacetum coccineum]